MPGFDGTGPAGMGPMTGRGFGPCGRGLGWRFGLRRGFGFGARRGWGRFLPWNWPQTKDEQKKALADYKKALQEEIEDVEKALADLDQQE